MKGKTNNTDSPDATRHGKSVCEDTHSSNGKVPIESKNGHFRFSKAAPPTHQGIVTSFDRDIVSRIEAYAIKHRQRKSNSMPRGRQEGIIAEIRLEQGKKDLRWAFGIYEEYVSNIDHLPDGTPHIFSAQALKDKWDSLWLWAGKREGKTTQEKQSRYHW